MKIFLQKRFWLRAAGMVVGVINLFGSLMAWKEGNGAEPVRYLVSVFVLLFSGILWLVFSLHPKLELSVTHYKLMVIVLALGLLLGLIHVYKFCGGECGCFAYYGYPGRWLQNSRCTYSSGTAWWEGTWRIDNPSLIADLFFWSGAGLIVSLLWTRFKSKPSSAES
jgi:hypothetical protein